MQLAPTCRAPTSYTISQVRRELDRRNGGYLWTGKASTPKWTCWTMGSPIPSDSPEKKTLPDFDSITTVAHIDLLTIWFSHVGFPYFVMPSEADRSKTECMLGCSAKLVSGQRHWVNRVITQVANHLLTWPNTPVSMYEPLLLHEPLAYGSIYRRFLAWSKVRKEHAISL